MSEPCVNAKSAAVEVESSDGIQPVAITFVISGQSVDAVQKVSTAIEASCLGAMRGMGKEVDVETDFEEEFEKELFICRHCGKAEEEYLCEHFPEITVVQRDLGYFHKEYRLMG